MVGLTILHSHHKGNLLHSVLMHWLGFDGGLTGPRQFSDPQLAVINTTSWTWTQTFTPDSEASTHSSGQLSPGAIYGIVVGCFFLFSVGFFFFIRWYLARRYRREGPPLKGSKTEKARESKFYQLFWWPSHSQSSDPLTTPSEEDRMLTMENIGHGTRTSSSTDVSFPPLVIASRPATMSASHGTTPYPAPPKSRDKSSFLIIPYAPPDSPAATLSTSATLTTTDWTLHSGYHSSASTNTSASASSNSSRGAGSTLYSLSPQHQRPHYSNHTLGTGQQDENSSPSFAQFSKGDRLPQDVADIQQGFYNKTLQHSKYYDIRRQNEIREHPELDRSGTMYSLLQRTDAEEADNNKNRKGNNLQRQGKQQLSRQKVDLYDTRRDLNNLDSMTTFEGAPEPSSSTITATTTAVPLSTSISARSSTFPSKPLREIEVGEESIQGEWNGVEDGTLLMSSHLETSALSLPPHPAPFADGFR